MAIISVLALTMQLLEAINSSALALGTLNSLTLASGKNAFNQKITHHGEAVTIKTPSQRIDYLKIMSTKHGVAVCVPLDYWTRLQFNTLETFLKENLTIPKEIVRHNGKRPQVPIMERRYMYVHMDRHCLIIHEKEGSEFDLLNCKPLPILGKGFYSFEIKIQTIYMGPRRDGRLFTLNPYLVSITFKNDVHVDDDQLQ